MPSITITYHVGVLALIDQKTARTLKLSITTLVSVNVRDQRLHNVLEERSLIQLLADANAPNPGHSARQLKYSTISPATVFVQVDHTVVPTHRFFITTPVNAAVPM